jgi:predicted nucleic acid-binding protein
MNRFVLDCSVTMAWCFEDEADPHTDAVLASLATQEAIVPNLWPLEVANVLAICERKGRITSAEIAQFLQMLGNLPIIVDSETARRAFGEVLSLARTEQLSAYDAAYLELALREGCPLATLDATLAASADKLGVRRPR